MINHFFVSKLDAADVEDLWFRRGDATCRGGHFEIIFKT